MLKIRLNSESREAGSGIDNDVGVDVKVVSSVGGKLYASIGKEALFSDSQNCIFWEGAEWNKMLRCPV